MKDMMLIQIVNILTGDYVDLAVPVCIQGTQLLKLSQLDVCKVREIFSYQFHLLKVVGNGGHYSHVLDPWSVAVTVIDGELTL